MALNWRVIVYIALRSLACSLLTLRMYFLKAIIGAEAQGTVFTTPWGALNLATTGSVGSETWSFGAGWAYGTPSAGILFQYQYYWDLGSVPFTAQQRQSICRCKGAAPGAVPSQKIRAMAVAAGEDKKAVLKQDIKQSLPFVLSGNYANQKIDQAPWDENIW